MTNSDKNDNFVERRKIPRAQDRLFKVVIALNAIAWAVMVVALIVYHQGKPELATGFNKYLGIESREEWIADYFEWLIVLLRTCLVLSLAAIVLRSRRSRRKHDHFGFNLLFLCLVVLVSLYTLTS